MKRYNKSIIYAGILASFCIGISSCSQQDSPALPGGEGVVTFRATLNASARSTETAFETGDAIGVFAVLSDGSTQILKETNYADNVKYIYDGSRFNPESEGIVKEEDEALAYYAVYPYVENCGPKFKFNINVDQSTHEATSASDLCTVSTGAQVSEDVELKFYHRLSKLVLNINGFNIAGDMDLQLLNAYSGAYVDMNANEFRADYDSPKENIKPVQENVNSYSVIIPPQKFTAGSEFVKVTLNGHQFTIKTPDDLYFASGRMYSFNATLINGELVLGTGHILPWDDQTVEDEFTENYFAIENASFVNDEFEEGTDDSDPFEISANEGALAGGMNFVTINCEQEYSAFELSVKGITGYWEYIPENSGTRASHSYTIPIMYGTNFSEDMEMIVCGRKADGTKSVGYDVNFRYVDSKSGDLNINLTFSTPKDVDLHLYTPSGQHIYYADRGGSVMIDGVSVEYGLDHDSNAGCSIDNLNNENIFIPAQLIEEGTYRVVVDMYRNCNTSYNCEWSIVARYKGEIIENEFGGGNPISGVYSANCDNRDMTTVMEFTLHPGTDQNRIQERLKKLNVTPRKLTPAEIEKIREDKD